MSTTLGPKGKILGSYLHIVDAASRRAIVAIRPGSRDVLSKRRLAIFLLEIVTSVVSWKIRRKSRRWLTYTMTSQSTRAASRWYVASGVSDVTGHGGSHSQR